MQKRLQEGESKDIANIMVIQKIMSTINTSILIKNISFLYRKKSDFVWKHDLSSQQNEDFEKMLGNEERAYPSNF